MFVFSIKASKKKIFIFLAAILLIVTAIIVGIKMHKSNTNAKCDGVKYNLTATTNEERVSFFGQFGWEVKTEPIEIKDVVIPTKFNDVYINYNNIQKEQGLDLLPYAGKSCQQWIYAVTNYPKVSDVRGTILVFDNKVIGGDLNTAALDGFMTGLNGEKESDNYSVDLLESSSASASKSSTKSGNTSAIPTEAWPTD